MTPPYAHFLGIDIAKHHLDVAGLPDGATLRCQNTAADRSTLLARRHVNPHIGGDGLERHSAAHVESRMSQLERRGHKPRLRKMALGVLQMSLATAV